MSRENCPLVTRFRLALTGTLIIDHNFRKTFSCKEIVKTKDESRLRKASQSLEPGRPAALNVPGHVDPRGHSLLSGREN